MNLPAPHLPPSALLAATLAIATAPLLAQQSGGPLLGSAFAFSVRGGLGGQNADTLVHRTGIQSSPVSWPTTVPGAPNLRHILALHGGAGLTIDDFSTGRDDIMVDGNGVISVPPQGWGVYLFSVRQGAAGAPQSRIAAEPAADRAAAVFSWVLPGSAVPPALIDHVERAHGRTDLRLPANSDLDALDLPLPMGIDQTTLSAREPGFGALLPVPEALYFTVSNQSLTLVPAAWWLQGGVPTPPSGATVFRTLRSSQFGAWTPPHVWKTYAELGLLQSEDIDALAYGDATQQLLFSCVGNARDQLLVVDLGTDGAPVPQPVKKSNNTPVSDAVGTAGGDDIDAVCTLDPRIRSGLYVPDDFGASCGTPRPAYQEHRYPVGVQASAYRRFAGGQSRYESFLLGFPPQTGVGPGIGLLVLTLGDTLSPAITAAVLVRNPSNSVAGDPQQYTLAIPPNFALSGLPVTFRWFAADQAGTELVQAYPIKVFL